MKNKYNTLSDMKIVILANDYGIISREKVLDEWMKAEVSVGPLWLDNKDGFSYVGTYENIILTLAHDKNRKVLFDGYYGFSSNGIDIEWYNIYKIECLYGCYYIKVKDTIK